MRVSFSIKNFPKIGIRNPLKGLVSRISGRAPRVLNGVRPPAFAPANPTERYVQVEGDVVNDQRASEREFPFVASAPSAPTAFVPTKPTGRYVQLEGDVVNDQQASLRESLFVSSAPSAPSAGPNEEVVYFHQVKAPPVLKQSNYSALLKNSMKDLVGELLRTNYEGVSVQKFTRLQISVLKTAEKSGNDVSGAKAVLTRFLLVNRQHPNVEKAIHDTEIGDYLPGLGMGVTPAFSASVRASFR